MLKVLITDVVGTSVVVVVTVVAISGIHRLQIISLHVHLPITCRYDEISVDA